MKRREGYNAAPLAFCMRFSRVKFGHRWNLQRCTEVFLILQSLRLEGVLAIDLIVEPGFLNFQVANEIALTLRGGQANDHVGHCGIERRCGAGFDHENPCPAETLEQPEKHVSLISCEGIEAKHIE